jgi:hypothetical protein
MTRPIVGRAERGGVRLLLRRERTVARESVTGKTAPIPTMQSARGRGENEMESIKG